MKEVTVGEEFQPKQGKKDERTLEWGDKWCFSRHRINALAKSTHALASRHKECSDMCGRRAPKAGNGSG